MDVNPYQSPRVPAPQQPLPPPNDGKHCPGCGEDIGIWPVMWATIPGRCRCPHCRANLTWNHAYLATFVMSILTLVVVGVAGAFLVMSMVTFYINQPFQIVGLYLALTVPPAAVICWAGAAYQRRNSILKLRT